MVSPRQLGWVALAAVTLTAAAATAAHPIPVINATAYVAQYRITLRVEVYVEDLDLFHDLNPDEEPFIRADAIQDGVERHKEFLLQHIQIRDVEGEPLIGKVTDVLDVEMGPEGISVDELMQHTVSYQLEYELEAATEFLTVSQDIGADILVPSEMHLRIKQEGTEVPFQTVLRPNKPYSVRFDWKSPPLPASASQEAWEKWFDEQRTATLGITRYSSVYSFIYITNHEVRHEILMPLQLLESDFKLARKNPAFLEIEEQAAGEPQIAEFFSTGNPVMIDGVHVKPVVDQIDFYGLSLKDFAKRAGARRVSAASCRVGVILVYSTKGPPTEVEVTWDKFNSNLRTVDSVIIADDQVKKFTFSKFETGENTFVWQRQDAPPLPSIQQVDADRKWSVPLVSAACLFGLPLLLIAWRRNRFSKLDVAACAVFAVLLVAAAWYTWPHVRRDIPMPFGNTALLSDREAEAVFATLHKNIYRAFDYYSEDDVYDALAKSVDGELLRELYLKIRNGLTMQEQGGAVSRVQEVTLDTVRPERNPEIDSPGFGLLCRWKVNGTVEHWGHIHSRTNQYEARFTVEPRDRSWKVTDLEIVAEERLKFETGLREF